MADDIPPKQPHALFMWLKQRMRVFQLRTEKGVAGGYPELDSGAQVPVAQIPVGSGVGDVVGPASAVLGNLLAFGDTSGKVVIDSLKARPSGAIVGTSDTQDLSQKKISLRAGAAAAGGAPLYFTSGTNLTAPVSGAVEFDGTNLYVTIAGVRQTIETAAAATALIATHAALATDVHGHTVSTSFPGSPADGDTCYRTDHDIEYTFDGTRWLSQPFPLYVASVRGSAVSTFSPGPGGQASDDAGNAPIHFGRKVRVLTVASALKGATGGRVWTSRLRINGAGSDSFACSNTITSVFSTWVAAAQEAVGLSLAATDRVNLLTNATGGTENYQYTACWTCAWEG